MLRAARRPGHGEAISLARLDRHSRSRGARSRAASTHRPRRRTSSAGKFTLLRSRRRRHAPFRSSKSLEPTVFANRHSAGFEHAAPGEHELVGPKLGIVVVVPAAGQSGPKGRLELDARRRRRTAGPGSETPRSSSGPSPRTASIASFDRYANNSPCVSNSQSSRFALDQLAVERHRRIEQRLNPVPGRRSCRARCTARRNATATTTSAGSNRGLIANGELR